MAATICRPNPKCLTQFLPQLLSGKLLLKEDPGPAPATLVPVPYRDPFAALLNIWLISILVWSLLHVILSRQWPWPALFPKQLYGSCGDSTSSLPTPLPGRPALTPSERLLTLLLCGSLENKDERRNCANVAQARPHTKKSDFFLLLFNQSQSYCRQ